jgi:hypothetical protein
MLQYAIIPNNQTNGGAMSVLDNARHETVAQNRARGMSLTESAIEAGYGKLGGSLSKTAKSAPFQARVEEVKLTLDWGATRDLAPVINELALAAKAAIRKSTEKELVAWLKAAGELLKIVADLKQRLPPDPQPAEPYMAPMTSEEWARKFKPRA